MTAVFGAKGDLGANRPAEMRIGDSVIIVSDGAGLREPISAFLYVYAEDVDAIYKRAIQAGAESLEVPAEMPYGDRRAMVKDAWGNLWQIATHRDAAPVKKHQPRNLLLSGPDLLFETRISGDQPNRGTVILEVRAFPGRIS